MLLHPRNLKHHVAASSRGRYALHTIALMKEGTLSTDGYSLLFAPYPDEDPKDAPKIDGIDPASRPPSVTPFLLSLHDARKVVSMAGKGRKSTSPLAGLIQAEIKQNTIHMGTTDLESAQVLQASREEGVYPEVGRVIPDYTDAHAISIELDHLLRALKALKGASTEDVVTMRFLDDQSGIGFSTRDGAAMLVMPVPVEKKEEHVPDQLAKLRDTGPGVAAPPEPEEGEDSEDGAIEPVETEASRAKATTAPAERMRRSEESAPDELAEIIGV